MGSPLPSPDAATCQSLSAAGVSHYEIARRLGRTRHWVRQVCGRRRVVVGGELTGLETASALGMRLRECTFSEIARRFWRTVPAVKAALGEWGVARVKGRDGGWPKPDTDIATALAGRVYEDVRLRRPAVVIPSTLSLQQQES